VTREERLHAVKHAFDAAMRRLSDRPAAEHDQFQHDCMKAIVGAAALLDRDPVALAADLADGRLAEYLTAAEGTIPLPLDDPATVRVPVQELLEEAIQRAESEREQLERRLQRILRLFDRATDDLRRRARQAEGWRREWVNTRSIHWLDEDWRRVRGLSRESQRDSTGT
jgi:hypothetical protein